MRYQIDVQDLQTGKATTLRLENLQDLIKPNQVTKQTPFSKLVKLFTVNTHGDK